MVPSRKNIEDTISEILSAEDFKRKRANWYFETSESICVLNLQKSRWGHQYYINLGVFVKKLGDVSFPKEHQCHIRGRLSGLVGNKSEFEQFLNLENHAFSDDQRKQGIVAALRDQIPFLSKLGTLAGIESCLRGDNLSQFLVSLKVEKLFGE